MCSSYSTAEMCSTMLYQRSRHLSQKTAGFFTDEFLFTSEDDSDNSFIYSAQRTRYTSTVSLEKEIIINEVESWFQLVSPWVATLPTMNSMEEL
ncbi:hypothetical protein AVEN_194599-1 [Araneus ventricosus]|uniref:Uncharacterized protein n=1 Tax=Araneus ventricosus TaxID=182803 RepID=A0A4Y2A771_ARAVE|nr:hypothetical protein AVEN_194599-1 [Araneus ventricosus]